MDLCFCVSVNGGFGRTLNVHFSARNILCTTQYTFAIYGNSLFLLLCLFGGCTLFPQFNFCCCLWFVVLSFRFHPHIFYY